MYLVAMAARHGRGVDKMDIGTTIKDPNINDATVARGMGVYGEGPITDPKDFGPALAHAIAVVKTGVTAVVDVVTESTLRSIVMDRFGRIAVTALAVAALASPWRGRKTPRKATPILNK